jgi:tetratricopeptide (TPR) repeat protein
MSRLSGFGAALAFALSAGTAGASPSIWQRAVDPSTKHVDRALRRAEYMLDAAVEAGADPGLRRSFALNAVAMLELFGDRELPDPTLKFLIARALDEASVGREAEIRALLESALGEAPGSYLAADAWVTLGISCNKLGDFACEFAAYSKALEIQWEPERRALIYSNRGETQMTAGNLRGAIADYRSSIRLASHPLHQALAHFGLAVALERSGDLPAALRAVAVADAIRIPIPFGLVVSALDSPGVFFNPEYEIHYYTALAHMAAAEAASDPGTKRREYDRAIERWSRYLDGAERDGQRWVPNARAHRARCERAAEKLPRVEGLESEI